MSDFDSMTSDEKEYERKKLAKMPLDKLEEEIARRMRETLEEELLDAPRKVRDTVNRTIEEMVIRSLGFKRDHWKRGEWELLNGEKGAVGRALGELALKQAQALVPDFVSKLVEFKGLPKGALRAAQTTLNEHVARAFQQEMWRWTEEEGKRRGEALIARLATLVGPTKMEKKVEDEDADEDV